MQNIKPRVLNEGRSSIRYSRLVIHRIIEALKGPIGDPPKSTNIYHKSTNNHSPPPPPNLSKMRGTSGSIPGVSGRFMKV